MPLMEAFKDDFSSGAFSSSWSYYNQGNASVSVVNQAAQFTGGGAANNYAYLGSSAFWTFTGSYVSAKVGVSSHFTTPGNPQDFRLVVNSAAGGDWVRLMIQGGTVSAETRTTVNASPVTHTVNLGTYNPTTMLYWRLRHAGTASGNVVFAGFSADNASWTEIPVTGPYPATWGDSTKFTWTVNNNTSSSGGTATIDDSNIILPPPSKRPAQGQLWPRNPQGGVIPAGGTAGQLLTKSSGSDYDAAWSTPPATSPVLPWKAGNWYMPLIDKDDWTGAAGLVLSVFYIYPVQIPNACTITGAAALVTTAGTSTNNVFEVSLWADNGSMRPGARLCYQTQNVGASTGCIPFFIPATTFTGPTTIWVGVRNGAPAPSTRAGYSAAQNIYGPWRGTGSVFGTTMSTFTDREQGRYIAELAYGTTPNLPADISSYTLVRGVPSVRVPLYVSA